DVDNAMVRKSQIKRLEHTKANRDNEAVTKALKALTECAKTNKGNMLKLAIEAARHRATLGEISDALEEVFGRYKAETKSFSGVYSKEIKNDKPFKKAQELADQFAEMEGRRPRIMV